MTLKGGIPKLLLTLRQVIRLRNREDVKKKTVIHISPLIYWCVLLRIANVRGLSSTLDGDGGIAAPKKILSIFLEFQEGWGIFLPFFLPV